MCEHPQQARKKTFHVTSSKQEAENGAEDKPSSVVQAAKAICPVQHVCQSFEVQTSCVTFAKDFDVVLNVLIEEKVFCPGKLGDYSIVMFVVGYVCVQKFNSGFFLTSSP